VDDDKTEGENQDSTETIPTQSPVLPGKATARYGKTLVASAIALVVGLVLVMLLVQSTSLRQSPKSAGGSWVALAALLLCCVHLYRGSNWARRVLGAFLAFIGLIWTLQVFLRLAVQPTWGIFLLAVPGALTLVFAGTLMFSKSVREYLTLQRNSSGTLGSRVLKAAWIVLLAYMAFVVILDIWKIV